MLNCAIPSCGAPLALDREEAIGVQWADGVDASEESLFVVCVPSTICAHVLRASVCLRASFTRDQSNGADMISLAS